MKTVWFILTNLGQVLNLVRWLLAEKKKIESDVYTALSPSRAALIHKQLQTIFEELSEGATVTLPEPLKKFIDEAWLKTILDQTAIDNVIGDFGEVLLQGPITEARRQELLAAVQRVCDIVSQPEYVAVNSPNQAELTERLIGIRDVLKGE